MVACGIGIALGLNACREVSDVTVLSTRDGSLVNEFSDAGQKSVVLILDPVDWFRCYTGLAAWLHWGLAPSHRTTVLFTRDPTTTEQKALNVAGLRVDGVLERPTRSTTPIQILFDGHDVTRIDFNVSDADILDAIREIGSTHERTVTGPGPATQGGDHDEKGYGG